MRGGTPHALPRVRHRISERRHSRRGGLRRQRRREEPAAVGECRVAQRPEPVGGVDARGFVLGAFRAEVYRQRCYRSRLTHAGADATHRCGLAPRPAKNRRPHAAKWLRLAATRENSPRHLVAAAVHDPRLQQLVCARFRLAVYRGSIGLAATLARSSGGGSR